MNREFINDVENLPIEIYLKYYHLEPSDLIELLKSLNKMYTNILMNGYPVYYSEKYERAFRNIFQIEQINTGNSINIKLKEGWKPEFRISKDDLDIKIPKLFGIPAIILYAILLSSQKILDIENKHLDNQLKEMELKLRKLELYEKIQRSIYPVDSISVYKYPNNLISSRYNDNSLSNEADELIHKFYENGNIYHVEFNNVVIKQLE